MKYLRIDKASNNERTHYYLKRFWPKNSNMRIILHVTINREYHFIKIENRFFGIELFDNRQH